MIESGDRSYDRCQRWDIKRSPGQVQGLGTILRWGWPRIFRAGSIPQMRLGALADHTIGVSQVRILMSGSSVYSGNSVSNSHFGVFGRHHFRHILRDIWHTKSPSGASRATVGMPNRVKCTLGNTWCTSRLRTRSGRYWYVKSPSGASCATVGTQSRFKCI